MACTFFYHKFALYHFQTSTALFVLQFFPLTKRTTHSHTSGNTACHYCTIHPTSTKSCPAALTPINNPHNTIYCKYLGEVPVNSNYFLKRLVAVVQARLVVFVAVIRQTAISVVLMGLDPTNVKLTSLSEICVLMRKKTKRKQHSL